MNFCSDNFAGADPEILAALTAANGGSVMAYGDDDLTRRVEAKIAGVFETAADVFLVATGTAANSLCLSVMAPPFGAVFCHPGSHIQMDECGAPEFFSGGAKLLPLPDHDGKIRAEDLRAALDVPNHGVHHVKEAAVSITQSSEAGTVYSIDEVRDIAAVAHEAGLMVHMDGARFANAVVGLGCSPAEATWRAGVDALSFGASKNGALGAEAAVLFERSLAETFAYRRKRSGHLFSKMRFLAAQFDAYLEDDLWLRNAAHANAMAARLADGLRAVPGASLRTPVEANELFPVLPEAVIQGLEEEGFQFYRWPGSVVPMVRLVTAFDTRMEDVDAFIASARRHGEAAT
jgi:threonine aldolase